MLKKLILFLIFSVPIQLHASCVGPFYTITELLNHEAEDYHIFSCKILGTYMKDYSFESIAVITNIYKGNPKDTVYLRTGGDTTAGGQRLMPESEWLIFSKTRDSLHFGATVCDPLSTRLIDGNYTFCKRYPNNNRTGKIYIDILNQYKKIRQSKYTGDVSIIGDGVLYAKGSFKNGLLDGEYLLFEPFHGKEIIRAKKLYKLDKLIKEKTGKHSFRQYEYISPTERKLTNEYYDTTGLLLRRYHTHSLNFNRKKYREISYRDGYYFNIMPRDSSNWSPLGEGYYKRGARVEKWKFFNKKGELVRTKVYPDIKDDSTHLILYEEDGLVRLIGKLENGKRVGVWKSYKQGKISSRIAYNSSGEKKYEYEYRNPNYFEFTPYSKNKIHGQKTIFGKNERIGSIETFRRGIKHGITTYFTENGDIKEEINFINGRRFSVTPHNIGGAVYVNNYLNGHFIQNNYDTGKIMFEGDYWNGYRTGIWIHYGKDGSYSKSYYPVDKKILLYQCQLFTTIKTESYDKNGNLIQTWEGGF